MAFRRSTEIFYKGLVHEARNQLRLDPRQSPAHLARTLACSNRTLNRAFAAAGRTIREERDGLRLDRAARTLLGEKSPAEAARRAGYASSRQLAGPFRRRFGMTPSRVRELGRAISQLRWQAKQPGPLRGSWQQRQRSTTWRKQRHVLRVARVELIPHTVVASHVERALQLRLSRPRTPRVPLSLYEVFGPAAEWVPEHILSDTPVWTARARRRSETRMGADR